MIFFEPEKHDKGLMPWDPFKGMVVPRPIWASRPTMARITAR